MAAFTRRVLFLLPALPGIGSAQDRPLAPRPLHSFALDELLLIQDFFKGEGRKYIPALQAMERKLPAAALSRLKLGAAMPLVLQRSTANLPEELAARLPPAAPGLVRGILGTRVLLVRRSGWILLDRLKLAPVDKKGR